MGVFAWLKRAMGATDTQDEPIEFAQGEERFQGLNMKEALDAHLAWNGRFEAMIKGEVTGRLRYSEVVSDDCCVLGQWIHGQARQAYGGSPEYAELKKVHAHFHETAGIVLQSIEKGALGRAREKLKALRTESGRVQLALAKLYASQQDQR